MPFVFLDYLTPFEAEGVARFLVEMIALEQEVRSGVVEYFARPERVEEFDRLVLRNNMTLGPLLDLAKPTFPDDGVLWAEAKRLKDLRNAVAHQLPSMIDHPVDAERWEAAYEVDGQSRPAGGFMAEAGIASHVRFEYALSRRSRALREEAP